MIELKRHMIIIYESIYVTVQKLKWFITIRFKYKLNIMEPEETIKYIKDNRCSVARFGDGEFGIMMDAITRFQKQTPELTTALKNVFNNRNDKLLICIPRYFNNTVGVKRKVKKYWHAWGFENNHQINVINMIQESMHPHEDYVFGDALITRPYIDMKTSKLAKKIFPQLQQLWEQKEILIIEGILTRLGVSNDLFKNAKSVKRILAPAINAFDYYDEIKKRTVELYNNELVLIALGPTATVLASDLSRMGIWALDVGHIDIEYEWFLRKAEKKIAIPGKYTNEVIEGRKYSTCLDDTYLSEIIAEIGKTKIDNNGIYQVNIESSSM